MEHRSAQAKQELILQEFLEKHHFDPPAAILPQLRIVTQKERDTLLKKGTRSMLSTLSWKVSTPSVKPGAMARSLSSPNWVPEISSVKWNAIRALRQFSTT